MRVKTQFSSLLIRVPVSSHSKIFSHNSTLIDLLICGDCSIRALEMHDCCVRVTALLEYFEQTLSKQHCRSKGQGCMWFSVPLSILVVRVNF